MSAHIIIDRSNGDVLANTGFNQKENSLIFGDISINIGNTLRVNRECFSQTPLFYSLMKGKFYASTHWQDLFVFLKKNQLFINLNYIRDYIQFQCPLTAETICDDIFYLRNGETLEVDEQGVLSLFFSPPSPSTKVDIRQRLNDILSALDLEDSIFHISSGLDSSILFILASMLHSSPLKLITCRTRGKGASDELDCVEQLALDFNADLKIFDFSNIDIFKAGDPLIEAIGYPIGHPSHLLEFLLDEKCKKKSNVITGRGPDECLAGYQWHTQSYSSIDEYFNRKCVTKPDMLKELFTAPFPVKDNFFNLAGQSQMNLKDRLLFDLRSISEAWDIIQSGISTFFNINVVSPFMDKQLRNTMFHLDDHLKIKNNLQKWYLRDYFRDLYPDYILKGAKVGFRLDLQPYLMDYTFSELVSILYLSSEFCQKYLNKSFVEKILRETLNNERNWGWQIWGIYLCSLTYDKLIH
jgi:asparagine synthetase B (glutamine-hydrolysing)